MFRNVYRINIYLMLLLLYIPKRNKQTNIACHQLENSLNLPCVAQKTTFCEHISWLSGKLMKIRNILFPSSSVVGTLLSRIDRFCSSVLNRMLHRFYQFGNVITLYFCWRHNVYKIFRMLDVKQ